MQSAEAPGSRATAVGDGERTGRLKCMPGLGKRKEI